VADTFLSVNSVVAQALPELLEIADEVVARTRARLAANLAALRDAFDPYVRRVGGGWVALLDTAVAPQEESLKVTSSPPHDEVFTHTVEQGLTWYSVLAQPAWLYDVPSDRSLVISLLPEEPQFAAAIRKLGASLVELEDWLGDNS
jgi:hypothetical protein